MPFRPNQPEHPEVNYQDVPIRALYQLQLLVEHIMEKPMDIHSRVKLYQSDKDPVVDPSSVDKLFAKINSDNKLKQMLSSSRHGVVYENLDNIQQKLCDDLAEQGNINPPNAYQEVVKPAT